MDRCGKEPEFWALKGEGVASTQYDKGQIPKERVDEQQN